MEGCRDRSNFDEIELTEQEINNLPSRFRSYAKEYSGQFQNELISVSPPYIKFPYDDSRYQECKVTIWNKTDRFLELDVQFPCSGVFKVSYANKKAGNLFASTAAVLKVRCITEEIQLCTDFLRIRVIGKNVKPLKIPLELYPSASWFTLPRIIFVPSVAVGKSIEAQIYLPRPHSEGRYYFIIKVLTEMDCFFVTPSSGYLNSFHSQEDARKVVIHYTPTEYTSLVYTFHIIFPEMPEFHPYEVNVYARCVPNSEVNALRALTKQMECLIVKSPRIKLTEPRLKFTKSLDDSIMSGQDESLNEDIFSHAGVVHFMLQKGGQMYEARKNIGPLGLTAAQQHKIYKEKEKAFHSQLTRLQVHEKNINIQNSKSFRGDDSILENGEELERLRNERDEQFQQYYTALGIHENDPKDIARNKLEAVTQRNIRSIREAKYDYSDEAPYITDAQINEEFEKNQRWVKAAALRRFVQAARVIITRKRAAKRLVKLRPVVAEMKGIIKKPDKRVGILGISDHGTKSVISLTKRGKSKSGNMITSMHSLSRKALTVKSAFKKDRSKVRSANSNNKDNLSEDLSDHDYMSDNDIHVSDQEHMSINDDLVSNQDQMSIKYDHVSDHDPMSNHNHVSELDHVLDHDHRSDHEFTSDHEHKSDHEHNSDDEHTVNHEHKSDEDHKFQQEPKSQPDRKSQSEQSSSHPEQNSHPKKKSHSEQNSHLEQNLNPEQKSNPEQNSNSNQKTNNGSEPEKDEKNEVTS